MQGTDQRPRGLCHVIVNVSEFLVADLTFRKVSPFCKRLGQEKEGGNKVRSNSKDCVNRTGLASLRKLPPSAVIYFYSRKSLLSGHQLACRSTQGLVLSLDATHGSTVYSLQFGGTKGWFLFSGVETLSGGVFSNS